MRTALAVLAGMLVGAFAGYMAGVYLACYLLWPQSNLCGLVGVFDLPAIMPSKME
jgi:hypothetical protein